MSTVAIPSSLAASATRAYTVKPARRHRYSDSLSPKSEPARDGHRD
jgi:hypothetical protein